MNTNISIKSGRVVINGSGQFCGRIQGELIRAVIREMAEKIPTFMYQAVTVYGLDRCSKHLESKTVIASNYWDAFAIADSTGGPAFDPLVAEIGPARRVIISLVDLINIMDLE